MDQWLAHKHRRPFLMLALFDPVYLGMSASLQGYLDEVAKHAKMDFLVHSEETLDD